MKNKNCNNCKYTSIGGQALIEGIMMRSTEKSALAVRLPDGKIDLSYMEVESIIKKHKILGLPIIRGVVSFVESLKTGYKAMMLSADKSGFADETNEETGETEKLSAKAWAIIMVIASVLAVALSVFLFMYLPRLAVGGLQKLLGDFSSLGRSVSEQCIKLVIFLAYMYFVSLTKDIKRVFRYHGAEHKTIFCYEAKLPLTVENIRKQKRFHPRCGTSFLILMLIVSIFFSTVVQLLFKNIYSNALVWTLIKILLIPIICGTGYEVLKYCGKHDNLFTKIASAPGLWVQRITVKEPDDSMIEIAIAAMKAVIPENADRTLEDISNEVNGETNEETNEEISEETNRNDNI